MFRTRREFPVLSEAAEPEEETELEEVSPPQVVTQPVDSDSWGVGTLGAVRRWLVGSAPAEEATPVVPQIVAVPQRPTSSVRTSRSTVMKPSPTAKSHNGQRTMQTSSSVSSLLIPSPGAPPPPPAAPTVDAPPKEEVAIVAVEPPSTVDEREDDAERASEPAEAVAADEPVAETSTGTSLASRMRTGLANMVSGITGSRNTSSADADSAYVATWSEPRVSYVSKDMLTRAGASAFAKLEWHFVVQRSGARDEHVVLKLDRTRPTAQSATMIVQTASSAPVDQAARGFTIKTKWQTTDMLIRIAWVAAYMPNKVNVWPFGDIVGGLDTLITDIKVGESAFPFIERPSPQVQRDAIATLPRVSHELWCTGEDEIDGFKNVARELTAAVEIMSIPVPS